MSRVLVLGSGFDSLLAAHAAAMLGHDVKIYAEEHVEETHLASGLLMAAIPMIDAPMAWLRIEQVGEADGFMDKLLNQGGAGHEPEGIEWDGRAVFDGVATYRWLRDTYLGYATLVPGGIGAKEVRKIIADLQPDHTFSGIDRDEICGDRNHSFAAAAVVTMPSFSSSPAVNVTFNGDPDEAWAMSVNAFGEGWRAYGAHRHPPVSKEKKSGYILPQGMSCDCHVADVTFVGKLGAWDPQWRRHRSFFSPFARMDLA